MYIPDFEYHAPDTLTDTCMLLAALGDNVKVLGGGTDILHRMKLGHIAPLHLVSLKKLTELREIRYEAGHGIVIGALASHNDICNSDLFQKHYLSVSMAAHSMANNQVRNIGTIGGNIVNASPLADLPPILMALAATVKLVGADGERIVSLDDFFTGPGKSVIARDEVLTEIVIPDQATTGSTYIKFGLRKSGSLGVVSVAGAITVQDSVIRDARIVLSAVAPVPMRAKNAEALLKDKTVSADLLEQAASLAAAESRPISDLRGSAEYRRELVRVLTKRVLQKAIDKGHV